MLGADGIFLAEADRIELIARDACVHEIVLGGLRARIAQRDVVFGRTALVAVSLDLQFVTRILRKDGCQFFGIGGQSADRVVAQSVCVVVEVGAAGSRELCLRHLWMHPA